MFKTGSKFLFGLAGFGFLAAVLWAGGTGRHRIGMDSLLGPISLGWKGYVGDHVGYSVLIGASAGALFLGIFLAALRDADADAAAQVVGLDAVPEVPAPDTVNYWPVVAAFSLGALALGLAVGPILFVIGLVGVVASTVEWAVRAWSDRATGDPEVNRSIRNRLMYPVEVPALAVIGIGGLVFLVSRILLAVPKYGTYAVFGGVPTLILLLGVLIVMRPKLNPSVVAGILLVGGLAVLAGGVAATIHGGREKDDKKKEQGKGEEGARALPHPSAFVIEAGR